MIETADSQVVLYLVLCAMCEIGEQHWQVAKLLPKDLQWEYLMWVKQWLCDNTVPDTDNITLKLLFLQLSTFGWVEVDDWKTTQKSTTKAIKPRKMSDEKHKEVVEVIDEIMKQCEEMWIPYDNTDSWVYAKHIATSKAYWDFCAKIKMSRIEFAKNIMLASEMIKYWKGICAWPKSIYLNYVEIYTQTRNKSVQQKQQNKIWYLPTI